MESSLLAGATNARRTPVTWVVYGFRLVDSSEYRYVGQTTQFWHVRLYQHVWAAGRGDTAQPVYGWIRRHGADCIVADVLQEVSVGDIEALDRAEIEQIARLRGQGSRLLNATDGGHGVRGQVWTEERRQQWSVMNSGEGNPRFGTTWSDQTRARVMANRPYLSGEHNPRFGVVLSHETRAKISANHADVSGENNPNYGKTPSPDTVEKRRQTMAAWTPERRAANSAKASASQKAIAHETSARQREAWANRTQEQRDAITAKRRATTASRAAAKSKAERAAASRARAESTRDSRRRRTDEEQRVIDAKRSAAWKNRTPEQTAASLAKRRATLARKRELAQAKG